MTPNHKFHLTYFKFIFLFTLLLFTGCTKEEEKPIDSISEEEEIEVPVVESYLTINIRENYKTEDTDDWVIVHDENGKLLDYKSFEANDTIEFIAVLDTISEFICYTTLRFFQDVSSKSHELSTTSLISKGDEIDFGSDNVTVSEYQPLINTGEFELTINDIPGSYSGFNLPKVLSTIKRGRLGGSGGGTNRSGLHEVVMNVPKYESHDDYIITVLDRNNELKYFSFTNPQAQNLSLDYSMDFLYFDSYVTVNLPENTRYILNVAGFEDNQEFHQNEGYWLHDIIFTNNEIPTNPLKIGYLDRFKKYRTHFNITIDDYNYHISKYGDKLQEIIIPERPNFSIINSSITNFDFSINVDYVKSNHRWTYTEGLYEENNRSFTGWSYSAPKGHKVLIDNLPKEILEKYPTIGFESLEHYSTLLYLQFEKVSEYYDSTEGITFYTK